MRIKRQHLCREMLEGLQNIIACLGLVPPPGAGTLEYAPLNEVDASTYEYVVSDAYNQQKALVATWYKLPYSPGSGRWQEEQRTNTQGDVFDVRVSAFLASDSQEVRGELDRMRRVRFLLRLTRSGQTILIGTPEQPLAFSSEFDSGTQGSTEARGHRLVFSGNVLSKSPNYQPIF